MYFQCILYAVCGKQSACWIVKQSPFLYLYETKQSDINVHFMQRLTRYNRLQPDEGLPVKMRTILPIFTRLSHLPPLYDSRLYNTLYKLVSLQSCRAGLTCNELWFLLTLETNLCFYAAILPCTWFVVCQLVRDNLNE